MRACFFKKTRADGEWTPGQWHRWSQDHGLSESGEPCHHPVAIVEDDSDGKVEIVPADLIRFVAATPLAQGDGSLQTVTVRGHSDDCLCVEGDLTEEFYPGKRGGFLAFGDGTLLGVEYDRNGCWRINRLASGRAAVVKAEATDPQEDYSDRVTLIGDLGWVMFGERMERIGKAGEKLDA